MYRRRTKGSKKFTAMAKASVMAREQKRLDGPAPDYPPELPELRREIIIIDHDHGRVEHHFKLYKSNRVDCYRAEIDGKTLTGRMGWARVLELCRKAFVRAINLDTYC